MRGPFINGRPSPTSSRLRFRVRLGDVGTDGDMRLSSGMGMPLSEDFGGSDELDTVV